MKQLAALAVLLLAGACGSESGGEATGSDGTVGSGASGPEAAVRELVAAVDDGSCTRVKKIVVTPSTVDCDSVGTLAGSYSDEGIDPAGVTMTSSDVTGDSATVTIETGSADLDETWQVERLDGDWRVLFDSVE